MSTNGNTSDLTIADLPRITREQLHSRLTEGTPSSTSPNAPDSVAIIDVRGDDYLGGHIRGAQHVPSSTLDHALPELVRLAKDKETVVFHCALSQQRGPSAALGYLRERERLLGRKKKKEGEGQEDEEAGKEVKEQKVYVLDGGFVKWQEK
jgi:rhodanese-related sulfurtransferase